MKCLVCGKSFEGAGCPRCNFPVLSILGDYEEGIAQQQPIIDAYRENFLARVDVGVETYSWTEKDGKIVLDRIGHTSVGNGTSIWKKSRWMPARYARSADTDHIQIKVYGILNGQKKEQTVSLPNLIGAGLQQLGAEMNGEMAVTFKLRNEAGEESVSQLIPLFEEVPIV